MSESTHPAQGAVVVSGAGQGLGAAIMEYLLSEGYQVVGITLTPEKAQRREAELRDRYGVELAVMAADVALRETHEAAARRALELAPLVGWVNNAVYAKEGNLHEPAVAEIERTFAVNIWGYLWGCSTAIRTFIGQRSTGSIVNISSVHARGGFPNWAAYDISKGAINSLTRYVAVEYGPVGIRANTIEPGTFATPLAQRLIDEADDPDEMRHTLEATQILGRLGRPEECASVTEFLLSDRSSFVTGVSMPVDGGATARTYPYPPDPELMRRYEGPAE